MIENETIDMEGVAIIGLAGRFPGANNIDHFWENLCKGVNSISTFSDEELINSGINPELIKNSKYVKKGGIINDTQMFDAKFFGYSPREAELIDPQHRIFLECAWESLENAGYNPETYPGSIGVFAGCGMNNYLLNNLIFNKKYLQINNFQSLINNDKDFLTTRISYKLNLRGPSICIQTACSTSLVAVQIACQNLLNYQCDMALAGGISLMIPQKTGYLFQEGIILSPDGHCRAFDEKASGTVRSEGAGIVVLKRLEEALHDNDNIYAVIKGAAINNDGNVKAGYTAPSINGQVEVILMAMAMAECEAEEISYIETHGTGTNLGDPIEIKALTQAYRQFTKKNNFCTIGSLKPNIGHLDIASGIAGLIKTILVLKNQKIPPLLHFKNANPELSLKNSPFKINTELKEKSSGNLIKKAAVSSFGIGGTNVHVILEQAPSGKKFPSLKENHILPFSAETESSLKKTLNNFKTFFKNNPNLSLADIAFTLQTGRKHFQKRAAFICQNLNDADIKLQNLKINEAKKLSPEIVFLFPGQGSQYINMGRELYNTEPFIKKIIDSCFLKYKNISKINLYEIIFPAAGKNNKIYDTTYAQPLIFILEYALAKYLINIGIQPAAMLGHSLGEYTAACIAEAISLEDILTLLHIRSSLFKKLAPGKMLSVNLKENQLKKYLSEKIDIAVINGSELFVLSGTEKDILKLKLKLEKDHIVCKLLKNSHPFHSQYIGPILKEYTKKTSTITMKNPVIPYISNISGSWISEKEILDKNYWSHHLRNTVNFKQGIKTLSENNNYLFLEVGPGSTLKSLLNINNKFFHKAPLILNTLKHPKEDYLDSYVFYSTIAKVWEKGIDLYWDKLYNQEQRKKISMPTYSFDKKKYWISKNQPSEQTSLSYSTKPMNNKNISKIFEGHFQADKNIISEVKKIWSNILGIKDLKEEDNFFDLGGHSLIATQLIAKTNKTFQLSIPLRYLFLKPTIKEQAAVIEEELFNQDIKNSNIAMNEKLKMPILFPIQPKGEKPPLFMVAGAHENRYFDPKTMKISYEEDFLRYLSNLIPHIGLDQPLYGFRPRGLIAWEKPLSSVEEMAKIYIKEMKKLQKKGPYYIGGECVGGIVAYEIARQLKQNNDEAALLIMMDTVFPTFWFALKEKIIYKRRHIKKIMMKWLIAILKCYKKEFFIFVKNEIKYLCIMLFPITKKIKEQKRVRIGSYTYQKTLLKYRAKKYKGKTTLIANAKWNKKLINLNWPDSYIKYFNIEIVPGDHLSRLTTYGHISGKKIKEALKICKLIHKE